MTDHDEGPAANRRPGRATRRRRVFLFFLALVCGAGLLFRRPLFQRNFGEVAPASVFRSAQPRGDDLERLIRERQLGSVLNLRGGSETDPWYAAEVRVTDARRVDFYDLPMSAVRRPARWELLVLIDLLQRCRYPLLIHCKWGSDRTGLVSALYLMTQRGEPPSRALGAFSIQHGHFPVFGPERLQEPLREYDAWLQAQRLAHTPGRFRDWVRDTYQADDPPSLPAPPPLRTGPRPQIVARPLPTVR